MAARLTGFKIDIKSETQAKEIEGWLDVDEEYEEYEDFEDYQESQEYLDNQEDYEEEPMADQVYEENLPEE